VGALLACGNVEKPNDTRVVSVSSVDITRDYVNSATAGDAKWAGKTVRVTGIGHYHPTCPGSPVETPCVMLEGFESGGGPMTWVYGWITSDKRVPSIAPMSTITLKCTVPDESAYSSALGVDLHDCDVLSTAAPASTSTARRAPPTSRPKPAPVRPRRR